MGKVAANLLRLEIRLFGHLEVALDGARFDLATPRKSLQVLAYLLLHRSAPVSREYLAFLLYPDDEEGAARAKLRATLSDLAKILPSPAGAYVSIETERVGWNPDVDLWLDVDAFEAAARDRARLDDAIDLYRGEVRQSSLYSSCRVVSSNQVRYAWKTIYPNSISDTLVDLHLRSSPGGCILGLKHSGFKDNAESTWYYKMWHRSLECLCKLMSRNRTAIIH